MQIRCLKNFWKILIGVQKRNCKRSAVLENNGPENPISNFLSTIKHRVNGKLDSLLTNKHTILIRAFCLVRSHTLF